MSLPDEDQQRTASYYDAVAGRYDQDVDGAPGNAAIRLAFCELVSRSAGPSGRILDYGCGTGTDAHWYATHGHPVLAYDISSGMVDQLKARNASLIRDGRIVPVDGLLDDAMRAHGRVGVIAANFAVLNHVNDLRALAGELAGYLTDDGLLIASMINPFFRRDVKTGWWWRAALKSSHRGRITLDGLVTTHRYFMSEVRRRKCRRTSTW